jgi:hypothetical protein
MKNYAIWITIHTGKYLLTFQTYDEAVLYNIKYGGGLTIIKNNYENY